MQVNFIDALQMIKDQGNINENDVSIFKGENELEFQDIMKDTILKKLSLDEFCKNIELGNNAKIINFNIFSGSSMTGLNNVIIGSSTLEKMQQDSVFREKIMKVIDEQCSISSQHELINLSPPVKSSGVIIYPDGTYEFWEEAYSNISDSNSNEDAVEFACDNNLSWLDLYSDKIVENSEDFIAYYGMPIDKKKSK